MEINSYSPASGRIIGENGSTSNIVDLLGGGTPVSEHTYNIDSYSPASGRVIGEDGKPYNLVDLLKNAGSGGVADLQQELTSLKEDLSDFKNYAEEQLGSLDEDMGNETSERENADDELQEQINAKQDKPTITTATETTATVQPNTIYEYGEVTELNLILSDTVGSYEVVFESGEQATVLSLTSQKSLLWHNEPVVLPNKVYTLAVEVGSVYARAVLSYAESV